MKEKSLLRCLQLACSTIVQDIAEMPDSVASVLDRAESAIFHVTNLGLTQSTVPAREELDKAIAMIESFQGKSRKFQGIQTGFHKLDEMTSGWKPGEMIVLRRAPTARARPRSRSPSPGTRSSTGTTTRRIPGKCPATPSACSRWK